jgi:hypothetical protein
MGAGGDGEAGLFISKALEKDAIGSVLARFIVAKK